MLHQHLKKSSNALQPRQSPVHPLQWRTSDDAADIPESTAALSAISRTSRVAMVSIQRFAPSHPPVISAVNRH